jgi:hypothetical protein
VVDVVLRERHNGRRGREFYQCAFPIFSEAEKAVAKLYDSRRVLLVAAAEPLTPDAVQRLSLQPGEVRKTA